MNIKTTMKMLVASALISSSAAQAVDLDISGFASITGGKVLSGNGVPHYGIEPTFLADYPMVSAYSEEFSFAPESLFGLQFKADLLDGLTATAQLVSRGADDWNSELEWAYFSYEFNENWTLQAGKKRLPLFYYSDFYDVGYAYTWIRPPADLYTWQIFNYTGANILYSTELNDDWSLNANIYAGSEDDKENKLLGDFFFGAETREIWKDIVGGVVNVSNEWLEVRLTHMQYTNERYIDGERQTWDGQDERTGKFYGLATNVNIDNWFLLTEINRLDLVNNLDSYMISTGYTFDTITPYVGYSELEEDAEDGENHNTAFAGLRWDFHHSAALKVQYDKVEDNSVDLAVTGDVEALTISVDLVF